MKTKLMIVSLVTLGFFSACSKPANQVLAKPADSNELFQQKSIYNIGLKHVLALTFDDGPSAAHTPALLDLLQKEGIKATFFLNGKNVPGNEWILKRMNDEGHVVANHSQLHDNLSHTAATQGMKAVYNQIMETHELIKPFFQKGGREYFRAPYGAWKGVSASFLNDDQILREYIGPIFWDIGGEISRDEKTHQIILDSHGNPYSSADWDCWSIPQGHTQPNLTLEQCEAGYHTESSKMNGGIVLMHDKTAQTVEMVSKLIPIWKSEGYTFVTLDEVQSLDKYTDSSSIARGAAQAERNSQIENK